MILLCLAVQTNYINLKTTDECLDKFQFLIFINKEPLSPTSSTDCTAIFSWETLLQQADSVLYLVIPDDRFKFFEETSAIPFVPDQELNFLKQVQVQTAFHQLNIQVNAVSTYVLMVFRNKIQVFERALTENSFQWKSDELQILPDDFISVTVKPVERYQYYQDTFQVFNGVQILQNTTFTGNFSLRAARFFVALEVMLPGCNLTEVFDFVLEVVHGNKSTPISPLIPEDCRFQFRWYSNEVEFAPSDYLKFTVTGRGDQRYKYKLYSNKHDHPGSDLSDLVIYIPDIPMYLISYKITIQTNVNCSGSDVLQLELAIVHPSSVHRLTQSGVCGTVFDWLSSSVWITPQDRVEYTVRADSEYTAFRYFNRTGILFLSIEKDKDVEFSKSVELNTAEFDITIRSGLAACETTQLKFQLWLVTKTNETKTELNATTTLKCSARFVWRSTGISVLPGDVLISLVTSEQKYYLKPAAMYITTNITELADYKRDLTQQPKYFKHLVALSTNADCQLDEFDYTLNIYSSSTIYTLNATNSCEATFNWTSEEAMVESGTQFEIIGVPSEKSLFRYFKSSALQSIQRDPEPKDQKIQMSLDFRQAQYKIVIHISNCPNVNNIIQILELWRSGTCKQQIIPSKKEKCEANFQWNSSFEGIQPEDQLKYSIIANQDYLPISGVIKPNNMILQDFQTIITHELEMLNKTNGWMIFGIVVGILIIAAIVVIIIIVVKKKWIIKATEEKEKLVET